MHLPSTLVLSSLDGIQVRLLELLNGGNGWKIQLEASLRAGPVPVAVTGIITTTHIVRARLLIKSVFG